MALYGSNADKSCLQLARLPRQSRGQHPRLCASGNSGLPGTSPSLTPCSVFQCLALPSLTADDWLQHSDLLQEEREATLEAFVDRVRQAHEPAPEQTEEAPGNEPEARLERPDLVGQSLYGGSDASPQAETQAGQAVDTTVQEEDGKGELHAAACCGVKLSCLAEFAQNSWRCCLWTLQWPPHKSW